VKVFEELKPRDCRWPEAEFDRGDFLFCGEPVTRDGCPYCREHMAMAYKPRRDMRPILARQEAHESARQEQFCSDHRLIVC
jgi:hypothetical protein